MSVECSTTGFLAYAEYLLKRGKKPTRPRDRLAGKATGRFCTKCGAVLDIGTAVALQDELEDLDEKFSAVPQDEDVQRLLMKKMIELGHG